MHQMEHRLPRHLGIVLAARVALSGALLFGCNNASLTVNSPEDGQFVEHCAPDAPATSCTITVRGTVSSLPCEECLKIHYGSTTIPQKTVRFSKRDFPIDADGNFAASVSLALLQNSILVEVVNENGEPQAKQLLTVTRGKSLYNTHAAPTLLDSAWHARLMNSASGSIGVFAGKMLEQISLTQYISREDVNPLREFLQLYEWLKTFIPDDKLKEISDTLILGFYGESLDSESVEVSFGVVQDDSVDATIRLRDAMMGFRLLTSDQYREYPSNPSTHSKEYPPVSEECKSNPGVNTCPACVGYLSLGNLEVKIRLQVEPDKEQLSRIDILRPTDPKQTALPDDGTTMTEFCLLFPPNTHPDSGSHCIGSDGNGFPRLKDLEELTAADKADGFPDAWTTHGWLCGAAIQPPTATNPGYYVAAPTATGALLSGFQGDAEGSYTRVLWGLDNNATPNVNESCEEGWEDPSTHECMEDPETGQPRVRQGVFADMLEQQASSFDVAGMVGDVLKGKIKAEFESIQEKAGMGIDVALNARVDAKQRAPEAPQLKGCLDSTATPGSPTYPAGVEHDAGVGLSSSFINQTLCALTESGALNQDLIKLGSSTPVNVEFVSFLIFNRSFPKLEERFTTNEKLDWAHPLMLRLRATTAPIIDYHLMKDRLPSGNAFSAVLEISNLILEIRDADDNQPPGSETLYLRTAVDLLADVQITVHEDETFSIEILKPPQSATSPVITKAVVLDKPIGINGNEDVNGLIEETILTESLVRFLRGNIFIPELNRALKGALPSLSFSGLGVVPTSVELGANNYLTATGKLALVPLIRDPVFEGTQCGNGIPERGEACDDGNLINEETNGCSKECKLIDAEGKVGNLVYNFSQGSTGTLLVSIDHFALSKPNLALQATGPDPNCTVSGANCVSNPPVLQAVDSVTNRTTYKVTWRPSATQVTNPTDGDETNDYRKLKFTACDKPFEGEKCTGYSDVYTLKAIVCDRALGSAGRCVNQPYLLTQ